MSFTLLTNLPTAFKNLLLVISVSIALTLAYQFLYPPRLIQPIQAQVNGLSERVDSLESTMDDNAGTVGRRFDNIERWLCFSDKIDAVKSGINCQALLGDL